MYSNYLNVYFFCLSIPVFHLSLFRFNLYLSIPISLSSDSSDSKRTLARCTSRWGWRWEEERDHWRCRWWWIRASQCGRRGGSLLRGVASGVGLCFTVRPMGRSLLHGVASGVGLLWVVVAGLTGYGIFLFVVAGLFINLWIFVVAGGFGSVFKFVLLWWFSMFFFFFFFNILYFFYRNHFLKFLIKIIFIKKSHLTATWMEVTEKLDLKQNQTYRTQLNFD